MIPSRYKFKTLMIATVVTALLSGCTTSNSVATNDDETARGREQLVRAFDAAWVRILGNGQVREILDTEPAGTPGEANNFVVRLADCLPLPELTPYPEEPVGLLKKILDSGEIRRMVQDVPDSPGSTTYYFTGITERYMDALLTEMGNHYGVKINYTNVGYPPGRLASTSAILNDEVDFISQLNATGGRTQNLRRRVSRRFSCTMIASSQFIQIPENSELVNEIKSLHDLMDRPDVRICAGPLTTQTAKSFLPEHKVTTRYIDDITQCDDRIKNGKEDIMINPLPDLTIAGMEGYKSVHTLIIAGTPLWVAMEGIACDVQPASGRGEMECRELEAP